MEHTISADGTRIAYERSGAGGSLLILVHGTSADRTRWAPILTALQARYTIYAVDRRGRGQSGDAAPYSIEREFEDIAAVVDSIGGPVDLLGHSYGALCSLEAARRTGNVRRLILYEPPIPAGVEIYPAEVIARIQSLLDAGDREGVLTTLFREIVRMPAHELDLLRSLPAWQARVVAAHTIPRELRGSESYRFDPQRFTGLTMPTLLLLGGDSPQFFRAAISMVHAALPASRIAMLPGQQHAAMNTAPDLFIGEVLRFLAE